MNKKKIIIGISILFSVFMIWYLFIKKSDFLITFKSKTATGVVYQGINEWAKAQAKLKGETYKLLENNKFDLLKYEISKGKKTFIYDWEIKIVNDSVSGIEVGIKEAGNSIYNRLTSPFLQTPFKMEQIKKIKNFKDELTNHLSKVKVKTITEGTSEEVFVAYINLKSVLQEKAQNMIMNDPKIMSYLAQNNIKIIGKPYVEVNSWDLDSENLDFNYCFPIDKKTKYIADEFVKFKTIPAKKGLKVSYFGNFRTSDRAWFAVLDYAKKHDKILDYKPLEHYFANPFNGGDELSWETQIIIPFAKQD
jgi:effector-binding domain-containing protein